MGSRKNRTFWSQIFVDFSTKTIEIFKFSNFRIFHFWSKNFDQIFSFEFFFGEVSMRRAAEAARGARELPRTSLSVMKRTRIHKSIFMIFNDILDFHDEGFRLRSASDRQCAPPQVKVIHWKYRLLGRAHKLLCNPLFGDQKPNLPY